MKSLNRRFSLSEIQPVKLLIDSVKIYKQNTNLFLKIALAVTVPSAIVLASQQELSGSDSSLATSLATIYLSLAITWVYFNLNKSKKMKISEIYKKISGSFLQALMASILLGLISLPLAVLVIIGFLAVLSVPQYWYYYILPLVFLALAFSLLITKYSLSYAIIIKENTTSFKAIAQSGRYLKKKTFGVFLGYLVFFSLVGLIYLLIIYLLSLNARIDQNGLLLSIINAILITFALPLLMIYLSKVYEKVSASKV